MEEELYKFDFVQFAVCDLHGIPRGKLVPHEMLSQACRDGVGVYSGFQYYGVQTELSTQLKAFNNFPSGVLRPLAGTVHPLEWCSAPKRQVGQVMCQLELEERQVFEECPRRVAQRQVERLHNRGYRFKSAFECEFNVLKGDKPFGDDPVVPYANLDLLDQHLDLATDMLTVLRNSGVHIEYFHPEYQAGQFEVCMEPQWGLGGADDAFMFRYGVRAYYRRHNLRATFMAIPFPDYHAASLHFNHSLWSQDGHTNVFLDEQDPLKLSATARHWLAGLMEHAPALTALTSPTLNCYRRLRNGFAPGALYWNMDDRLCTFRARTTGSNVFLENRLPSSACNPYLALAANIAAGLDGVERKLACPNPGPPGKEAAARQVPGSLAEALDALDKDKVLKEALGGKLVEYFLSMKRDIELKHFENVSDEYMFMKEREYYMPVM